MSLRNEEDLTRIIYSADVEHIPPEFVSAARIIDFEGESTDITPEEFEEMTNSEITLSEMGIESVRLVLDLNVVKNTIKYHSEMILSIIPG
jgi:hypothetical protein